MQKTESKMYIYSKEVKIRKYSRIRQQNNKIFVGVRYVSHALQYMTRTGAARAKEGSCVGLNASSTKITQSTT